MPYRRTFVQNNNVSDLAAKGTSGTRVIAQYGTVELTGTSARDVNQIPTAVGRTSFKGRIRRRKCTRVRDIGHAAKLRS